jgi:hypothetical protein
MTRLALAGNRAFGCGVPAHTTGAPGFKAGLQPGATENCGIRHSTAEPDDVVSRYAGEQSAVDRVLYEDAEQQARTELRCMWSDPDAVPPWHWRRRCVSAGKTLNPVVRG